MAAVFRRHPLTPPDSGIDRMPLGAGVNDASPGASLAPAHRPTPEPERGAASAPRGNHHAPRTPGTERASRDIRSPDRARRFSAERESATQTRGYASQIFARFTRELSAPRAKKKENSKKFPN
jgi:hypothetical protein